MALPFDDIASTTIDAYVTGGKLVDNIFKKHFLWNAMYRKGKIKYQSGGDQISVPVAPKTNSQVGWIGAYDTIGTTAVETATRARYTWKQLVCSIVISENEKLRNSGSKEQIVNLLESKFTQAESTVRETLSTAIWSATQVTNAILPLALLVINSGTLAGIDSGTETWWQAKYDSTSEPLTIADMSNMYNQTVEQPDIVATTQTLWEKYESLLQPQQRFMDEKTAAAGFDNLRFKRAAVVWDEQGSSTDMYFINTDYLFPVVHPQADFSKAPTQMPYNQLAFVSHIHWMGGLVTSNRRRLGRLTGRTA